jgi:protein-S-isoprenylcysteine O-methyltransferase Ste14
MKQAERANVMNRTVAFVYGTVCYILFLATFLYAIAFVGNIGIARTIDGDPLVPFGHALLINVALLGIFAVQHSGMARQGFKRWWTGVLPKPVERSTYVLFTNLALLLLFHQWEPMGGVIWDIKNPVGQGVMYSLFAFGWLLALYTTFLINHFDLFGLRQVWLYFRGKEYTPLGFKTPRVYQYVRHPLYVGFLFGFWATPTMTAAHLVFAIATTAYILIAIQLEERDLVEIHGQTYADYRQRVPMLVPGMKKKPVHSANIRPASTTVA